MPQSHLRFGIGTVVGWPDGARGPRQTSYPPEAQAAYDQGMQLMQEGKYPEALSQFNTAIRIEGSFPEAYIAKGDALKMMEDYSGAGVAYSRALEMDVNSAAAYNGRGECYMEMTPPDYNMAVNDFANALNLDRGNAKALSNLGHVLVAAGQDPGNSVMRLDEALAINPNDARAWRDRGMAHAQLQEFDKALEDLKKAVEVDSKDHENFATLAAVQNIQENYAEAVEAYTHAIENYHPKKSSDPATYTSAYLYRADARLSLAEHEPDAAVRTAALEAVLADADAVLGVYKDHFPDTGRALFRRGRAERMLERYSNAVDSLTRAIQAIPSGQVAEYASDAYLFRGICWYYIGSLDLARGDFEQASSTGTGFGDARVFLWIGYTYHKQGDFRRAIDSYSEAIAKAPGFALAHVNKGRAYMDLGEYSRAIESFNNAIRSEPESGDNYYNVGLAYIQLDDFQRAVDFLNLALKQENPQPKMYRAMAVALRGLGRDELANQYDQKAGTPPAGTSSSNQPNRGAATPTLASAPRKQRRLVAVKNQRARGELRPRGLFPFLSQVAARRSHRLRQLQHRLVAHAVQDQVVQRAHIGVTRVKQILPALAAHQVKVVVVEDLAGEQRRHVRLASVVGLVSRPGAHDGVQRGQLRVERAQTCVQRRQNHVIHGIAANEDIAAGPPAQDVVAAAANQQVGSVHAGEQVGPAPPNSTLLPAPPRSTSHPSPPNSTASLATWLEMAPRSFPPRRYISIESTDDVVIMREPLPKL